MIGPREGARSASAGAVPLLLALITFFAFLPLLSNDFVAWDDHRNLYENPDYRGLGWTQLRWMFTTNLLGHYIPLTWLSFGLDYVVWGMNPIGYHLTNLLLHIVGTVLFYFVARRLLARGTALSPRAVDFGGALAALYFAIHPLRVESVAWATERRDVLSGVFFFATILAYLGACEASGRRRRWLLGASLGAYLFGLMSKSIVMTAPLVLLLLDVYPLGRLAGDPREWRRPPQWMVLIEKTPYLLLGIVGAAVSYHAQMHGALHHEAPWLARVSNVGYSLGFYVFKTALPTQLSPLYEAPAHIDPWEPRFLGSGLAIAGASILAVARRRRWPAGLALWAYYGIVLAPVSGIVPLGAQLAADRYSYLPCLGWAVVVGAAAGTAFDAAARGSLRPWLARLAAGTAGVGLLGLGVLTWRQVQVWHDTESLWRHAVLVSPECATCHKFLGDSLMNRGAILAGLEHFQLAVALRPDRVEFRSGVGWALARLGRWPEALEQYRRVLEQLPNALDVRNNLAAVLLGMGRATEAIEELERALRTSPDQPAIRTALGFAFNASGKPEEAAEHLRRAIELEPDSATARLGLVQAYRALGRQDLARDQYEVLRTLDPQLAARVPVPR